jgi:cytochrome c-type biogenesis protein CcmH/NrfG
MVQSTPKAGGRRIGILLALGLILIGIGFAWRFIATDTVAQWRAKKLSDDALAKSAGEANAPFPYLFEWAKRLEASGRFEQAEHVYSRAMEMAPTNIETWLGFSRTAFAAGDWKKSSEVLAKMVEEWPDNADAHFTYASVLASTFRVRKAIEQLRSGLKLNPAKGEAYLTLGDLEMRADNPDAAVEAYAHAKALLPKTKHLLSRYGSALVRAGKYEQAKVELEAALKDDPSDINARFDMGRALANTGKEPDRIRALQELNRVVAFGENTSRAYLEAARIWLKEGDRGNGIQALEHAFDRNPNNIEMLTLLAQSYEAEGRQTEARKIRKALAEAQAFAEEHKKVLALLDADEEVVTNLIRLGRLDLRSQNLIEAQTALEAARYLDPGNAEAVRELKNIKESMRQ